MLDHRPRPHRHRQIAIVAITVLLGACVPLGLVVPTSPSSTPTTSIAPSLGAPPPPSLAPSANTTRSPKPSPTVTPKPPKPKSTPLPTLPPGVGLAPYFYHGSRTRKWIAITIDDGFSNSAVLADLKILRDAHVNATFFPIGHVVVSNPATWRTVAKAGCPIGNHTYDHANLTRYSYAQIVADIEKDNKAVSAIIGEPLLPVVRPMGGSWNQLVLGAATTAGEQAVVLWDTTDGDTAPAPSRTKVDLLVRDATRGIKGSIILMHANLPYAQQALPQIIAYYKARGYEFVTIGQMLGIPGPVPFPPAP